MSTISEKVTYRIAPREQALLDCVESSARAADRPVRPLHLQALLQLPRLANSCGLASGPDIERLLPELAQELPPNSEWLVEDAGSSPRSLRFHAVDAATARNVMQRFHYLRSPRTDGRAYGLSSGLGHLVALCVTSPMDVEKLRDLLSSAGRQSEEARVVSRVFAFEGAPKNSISYLLSRAAREERRLGATDFVTYVNPNMGFLGSSYRASGWHLLGTEPGTRYRYLDRRYITDRELAAKFGPHNDAIYERLLGQRFARTIMPLAPLLVFHIKLN